jgi:hypothetical protein
MFSILGFQADKSRPTGGRGKSRPSYQGGRWWLFFILVSVLGTLVGEISALAGVKESRGLVRAPEGGVIRLPDEQGREVTLYEESHALLIGISNYTQGWPNLPGVKADVIAVRKVLEQQGFEVEVVQDPNKEELMLAFDRFINRHGLKPDARLLFYFAGHGHTVRRTWGGEMGYIVPKDAPNPNRDLPGFLGRAIDMQQIEVYAKQIDAKHALFVFDSCFSGSMFATTRAIPENISYKTSKPVRQFITAGSADEQVPDVSVFRQLFVKALEGEADPNSDSYITGAELGEYLQGGVINYSHGGQHPQYGKIRHPELDKGDFVFRVAKLEPPAKVAADIIPPPVDIPPPPVPLYGHIQINVSVAQAQVYIDNKFMGNASYNVPLNLYNQSVGEIEVQIKAEGYQPERRSIKVLPQQWAQYVFVLSPQVPDEKPEVQKIAVLLDKAKKALNEGHYAAPEGDNAAVYAGQILDLDPKQIEAQKVLQRVIEHHVAQGEKAVQAGDLQQGQAHYQQSETLIKRFKLETSGIERLSRGIIAVEKKQQEQETRKLRLAELLKKANEALKADRLVTPKDDNAVAYANEVLQLEANQAQARQVLEAVAGRLVALGESAVKTGQIPKAKGYQETALDLARRYGLDETRSNRLLASITTAEQQLAEVAKQEAERKAQEQRIAELLHKAKEALQADRLIAPKGDNAAAYAGAVLQSEAGHAEARQMLEAVVARLTVLGESAVQRREIPKAKGYHQAGAWLVQQYGLAGTGPTKLLQQIAAFERQLAEESARAERIAALLKKAKEALMADRLMAPEGDNAVGYAEEILQLQANHPDARWMLEVTAARLIALGEFALQQNEIPKAQGYQQTAAELVQRYGLNKAGLTGLTEQITATQQQFAKETRKQETQQRLEDETRRRHEEEQAKRLAEQQAREAKIAALLTKAREALAKNQLSTPAGRNALEYTGQILRLDPAHPEARQILSEVVTRYATLSETAVAGNQLDQARRYQQAAEELVRRYGLADAEIRGLAEHIAAYEQQLAEEALKQQQLREEANKKQAEKAKRLADQQRKEAEQRQERIQATKPRKERKEQTVKVQPKKRPPARQQERPASEPTQVEETAKAAPEKAVPAIPPSPPEQPILKPEKVRPEPEKRSAEAAVLAEERRQLELERQKLRAEQERLKQELSRPAPSPRPRQDPNTFIPPSF